MFKMPFSKGLIDTLLATNGSETMAFVKSYNNYLFYYAFILIALLIAIKTIRFRALVSGVIASVLELSILTIGSVRHVKYLTSNDAILKRSLRSLSLARGFYSTYLSLSDRQQAMKFYSFFNNLDLPSDYLSSTGDVSNVILVIGENASRNFMQLYGYNAPNNPLLSQLANERE
ncbi:hypothetical protein JP0180_13550 [Helicobacter pylori]